MQKKIRLAIITTHPIQYNAPLYKTLTERNKLTIKVFYTWGKASIENKFDPGFGKQINWDIPVLRGYGYEFLNNVAKDPGSHHFYGIDNPDIISKIKEWQPDALFLYAWSFKSHLKVLRYFHKRIPILFRGDSTLLNDAKGFSVKKIIRHTFLKWVYNHIDAALYVGTQNKRYFMACGVPENKLFFAPHAVDNHFFSDSDELHTAEAKKIRSEAGIPDSDILFLYAGKIQEEKNLIFLITTFLKISHPNAHLMIVGNGPLESQAKKAAGENNNIHFIDFKNQSRMPAVYRAGDVFVLPSQSETWGLAVNEAMACSRAVLVSNQCGCYNDLISPGENGYVFNYNDPDDLISKFNLLLQVKNNLKRMGMRSAEVISSWNYHTISDTVEKVVSKAALNEG